MQINEIDDRLRHYIKGQYYQEVFSAAVLRTQSGFSNVRNNQPLGGPDGKRDILFHYCGQEGVGAVSFSANAHDSSRDRLRLQKKFEQDMQGCRENHPNAAVFVIVTNSTFTVGQKQTLAEKAKALNFNLLPIFDRHWLCATLIDDSFEYLRCQFLGEGSSKAEFAALMRTLIPKIALSITLKPINKVEGDIVICVQMMGQHLKPMNMLFFGAVFDGETQEFKKAFFCQPGVDRAEFSAGAHSCSGNLHLIDFVNGSLEFRSLDIRLEDFTFSSAILYCSENARLLIERVAISVGNYRLFEMGSKFKPSQTLEALKTYFKENFELGWYRDLYLAAPLIIDKSTTPSSTDFINQVPPANMDDINLGIEHRQEIS